MATFSALEACFANIIVTRATAVHHRALPHIAIADATTPGLVRRAERDEAVFARAVLVSRVRWYRGIAEPLLVLVERIEALPANLSITAILSTGGRRQEARW